MTNIYNLSFVLLLVCTSGAFSRLGDQPKLAGHQGVQSPTAAAIESDPRAWKEFFSEAGGFRIMFPGEPVEADNSSGGLSGRKFTLTTSASYSIVYFNLPTSEFNNNTELRKLLFDKGRDGLRDGIQRTTNITLLEEADTSLNGYPGRKTKISMENGGVARQYAYLVAQRLYTISVVTPKELLATDAGKFDDMRATKFLNSFRLAGPDSFKPAVEEKPDAWRVYSSTQGRFAIMFPGTPTDEDKSYDTPLGRCEARDYVLIAAAEYRVSYTDFVVDLEKDSNERNKVLDSIRDRVIAEFNAKVSTQNVISLDGHPGRMMTLTASDGSITRTKSYTVGKRLYQIMVTTPKLFQPQDGGRFQESWATKFFDSFKLPKSE